MRPRDLPAPWRRVTPTYACEVTAPARAAAEQAAIHDYNEEDPMVEDDWDICCECGNDHAAYGLALCTDCLEDLGPEADGHLAAIAAASVA